MQKKSFSKVLKNLTSENLLHSNDGLTLFNMESQKLTIKESPYWIKKRLLLMGFKPVNNIIDTINYLLLETGQVFFAYDLEILQQLTETSEIVFVPSYAPEKSVFPIEESKTIELTKDVLVLNINNKIISIAGLIQNYHTLVNTETSYVILQYGLYDSKKVKKSSKILGLRTNYSIKLEKQTDLNLFEQAHLRLMHIFWTQNIKFEDMRTNKNLFLTLKDNSSLLFRYVEQSQKKIRIVYKNLKRLTGPSNINNELSNFQIITNLKLLNFKVRFETGQNCYLFIPLTRRLDIEREVDVIEEVVRTIGFNKFEPLNLRNNQIGSLTKIEKLKRQLRNYFINLGFNESIHSILILSLIHI